MSANEILPSPATRVAHELRDAPGAEASVVARAQVVEPATGPQLVQRVVVERRPRGVVVRVDHPARRRVDDVRHLGERAGSRTGSPVPGCGCCTGSHSLPPWPLRMNHGGAPVNGLRLQVFAQRHLGAGEVRDVAAHVDVDRVLRAAVEVLQPVAGSRRGCGPCPKCRNVSSSRVPLNPVYCTLSAVPVAGSRLTIGPLFRRGTMSVAGGMNVEPIALPGAATTRSSSDAVAWLVVAEQLRDRDHPLAGTLVERGVSAR